MTSTVGWVGLHMNELQRSKGLEIANRPSYISANCRPNALKFPSGVLTYERTVFVITP